jgi:hypothetical protein
MKWLWALSSVLLGKGQGAEGYEKIFFALSPLPFVLYACAAAFALGASAAF